MAKLDTYTIKALGKINSVNIEETLVVLFEEGDNAKEIIQNVKELISNSSDKNKNKRS